MWKLKECDWDNPSGPYFRWFLVYNGAPVVALQSDFFTTLFTMLPCTIPRPYLCKEFLIKIVNAREFSPSPLSASLTQGLINYNIDLNSAHFQMKLLLCRCILDDTCNNCNLQPWRLATVSVNKTSDAQNELQKLNDNVHSISSLLWSSNFQHRCINGTLRGPPRKAGCS
jgi:hypothetical protein